MPPHGGDVPGVQLPALQPGQAAPPRACGDGPGITIVLARQPERTPPPPRAREAAPGPGRGRSAPHPRPRPGRLLPARGEVMNAKVRPELIDALMEAYVEWREECATLRRAYERWLSFPTWERELAFAAYTAALDREQQASIVYSNWIERVQGEIDSTWRRPLNRLRRRHRGNSVVETGVPSFVTRTARASTRARDSRGRST